MQFNEIQKSLSYNHHDGNAEAGEKTSLLKECDRNQ